jgi:DNA-directed RNA polymerase subunit RPC12/RpoP
MKFDEREIRLRLPSVGNEIVGVRDIEKRAEIIMKCSPVVHDYPNDYNVRDADEIVEEDENDDVMRCPYCGSEIDYIETRKTGIRYEYLYEDGDTEEYDASYSDDYEYICPRCGESLSHDDLREMGVRL